MIGVDGKRKRGRPPTSGPKHDPAHRTRPALRANTPVHVVLRCTLRGLRQWRVYHRLRHVVAKYYGRTDFHITHFSIQSNHLHLLVEADSREALTRGMRSFGICAARAIQKAMGRRGQIFGFRYHATQITSPQQARRTISYVLNNWRRHGEDRVSTLTSTWKIDPFSSGVSFSGWARKCGRPPDWYKPIVTTPPRTPLLATEWRLAGFVHYEDRPALIM